ncbi:MAG: hypothetical protein LBQ83_07455 [Candidatus Margulisbacteria bacterium]|jgi:hypothetical protein|nr:hypothetical protein [Candidatus Margulisiibacteriota bacterium]
MCKKYLLLLLILLCTLALTGFKPWDALRNALRFGEVTEFDYSVSALQWLPEIQQKAKEWRADAYLFAILESEIDLNGNSGKWTYLFYSPGSGKSLQYIYDSGFIAQKETVVSPLNPVYSLRIDTPTALYRATEAARGFTGSNEITARVISLIGPPYDSRQTISRWQVVFHGLNGTHRVNINATTGAVIP